MKAILNLLPFAALLASSLAGAVERPNLLLILADDLGYADLGCQGSQEVKSPHIDSIAANGVRCTAGYVTAPQCCPSRAGLITGRYQNRFGFEANWPVSAAATAGLPVTERTMAERLKAAGYATGMIGKWHLGDNEPMRPYHRGFMETFWNPNGGVLFPDKKTGSLRNMYRGAEPVEVGEYSTDAFGREAVEFIERHRREPWFLYLAFVPPHWPMEAKPEHLAQFAHVPDLHRRTFLAMMASLDENVGRVLAKLREAKLEEHTLVFFLSDNGGPTGRPRAKPDAPFEYGQNTSRNDPCRGVKGELLEGGIRIPFLVRWKGRIPAGKTYDPPVISLDLPPTALAAAGVTPPSDWKLDGANLLPFLTGEKAGAPHDALYWRFRFPPGQPERHRWAIRQGAWKLVKNDTAPLSLYNLAADIGETNNLAAQHPAKVRAMEAAWQRWNAELKEPLWGTDVKGRKPLREGSLPPDVRLAHEASVIMDGSQLAIECTGRDPQAAFGGIPAGEGPLTLQLRMKSDSAGFGQLFWVTTPEPKFTAGQNVIFEPIHDGQWHDYTLTLPVKQPAVTFLRLDPGSAPGQVRLERLVLQDASGHVLKAWVGLPLPTMSKAAVPAQSGRIEVAAYYFPQWHVDPINQARRGRDWTEWELVPKAKPRFEGHQQPKVPLWRFEREDDAQVMAKKIAAAADHGVDAFIFDWYFNEAGPFLHGALERGFFGATNNSRLKFAVMWANHDLAHGKGAVNEAIFTQATDRMIERYFRRPNYWRVNGGLYVGLYQLDTLIEGLGGVEQTAAALRQFRRRVRDAGLGELHLNASAQSHLRAPAAEQDKYPGPNALLAKLGFDSVTPYHWLHVKPIPEFPASDYARYRDASFEAMRAKEKAFAVPYLPVVCMGWDSSPRTPQDKPFQRSPYPWSPVLVTNTPTEFRKALELGRAWLADRPALPRALFIEAWNEWTEGSYLEPDRRNGMKYLEAVREVFGTKRVAAPPAN